MFSVYLCDKYGITLMESYPTRREATHYVTHAAPIGKHPGKYLIVKE